MCNLLFADWLQLYLELGKDATVDVSKQAAIESRNKSCKRFIKDIRAARKSSGEDSKTIKNYVDRMRKSANRTVGRLFLMLWDNVLRYFVRESQVEDALPGILNSKCDYNIILMFVGMTLGTTNKDEVVEFLMLSYKFQTYFSKIKTKRRKLSIGTCLMPFSKQLPEQPVDKLTACFVSQLRFIAGKEDEDDDDEEEGEKEEEDGDGEEDEGGEVEGGAKKDQEEGREGGNGEEEGSKGVEEGSEKDYGERKDTRNSSHSSASLAELKIQAIKVLNDRVFSADEETSVRQALIQLLDALESLKLPL